MQSADKPKGKSKASKEQVQQQVEQQVDEAAGAAAAAVGVEREKSKSEQQLESKIKARSRFSAAFRSLSKPKSKKSKQEQQQQEQQQQQQPEQQQLVQREQPLLVSSGGEDVTSLGEATQQKKKSLTRRLLQAGGLRKGSAKVRPHSLAASDDLSVLSSSQERVQLPASSGSSSTLQITISGKKVEPAAGKAHDKAAGAKGKGKSKRDDTYYLTPAEKGSKRKAAEAAAATTTAAAAAAAATSSSRSRSTSKLIVSKVSSGKEKPPPSLALPATVAQFEEKIVITESRRDTPPRERAPAKPSRAAAAAAAATATATAATVVQSASSSGAVRNISSRERQLMQQQQQRGHRLARSSSKSNSSNSNSNSNSSTTATPAISVQALETPQNSPDHQITLPLPAAGQSPPALPATPPPPLLSLSDVEEQTDAVSLAESAGSPVPPAAVQVRFAVGSAVRGPAADAYEAALAAAASQQPSSSEEPSDSSWRRHSFAQQQQLQLSDHDSIEGRRETLRYQSVASEYSEYNEEEQQSSNEEDDSGEAPATEVEGGAVGGGGGAAAAAGAEQSKSKHHMPAFGNLTMDQEMEPTIMSPSNEKREHLYKILVIGELGTGKTSFIKRYVHQFFSQNYRATIGVDFALKVLHWDANTIVRLQLWDIAGQERFGNMTRVYYKEAVGAFIVFDVTRSGTFDCVSKWKEDLDSKVQLPDGSPIPCILLANKCDQEKQGIVTQPERMDEYVRENGFAGWFETSAKENINIDEAARALVNKILINDKLISADATDVDKFNLNATDGAGTADGKNKCSC